MAEPRRPVVGTVARHRDGRWFIVTAAICLFAVGIALLSQHRFGMEPCPWCALQRLIFLAVAAAALIGSACRGNLPRSLCAAAVAALSIAGAASAAWQHFRAATSASCNLTLADRIISGSHLDTTLPEIFEPRASCAASAVDLLGVSYDLWSLALFVGLAAAGFLLLRRHHASSMK